MCNNKCNQKNILIFRNSNPCGCCSDDTSSVGEGIDLPSGGADGDVLAKQGEGLKWLEGSGGGNANLENIVLTISIENQTQFVNSIPVDKQLLELKIDGIAQLINIDYSVSGRNITWISNDFNLKPSLKLTIIVY